MLRSTIHAVAALALILAAASASAADDFKKIRPLQKPIQTASADVVLAGHGSYEHKGETKVPAGVELWIMGPPGSALAVPTGAALWHGEKITKLAILSKKTKELSPHQPVIYKAGQKAPNYTLHSPIGVDIRPGGPHVLGVEGHQTLDALWPRLKPFLKTGKTVRVFWAACTAVKGAEEPRPRVVHQ